MESFHAEYSKLLGYCFYVKFSYGSETKILITPAPGRLYFQICGKVFAIPLIAEVLSLENIIYQQEDQWVYIKIPNRTGPEIDLRFKKEVHEMTGNIYCKNCEQIIVKGIQRSYPMPSTNWETLSELWSCHPSHEPKYSLEIREKTCYVSLFYLHFLENQLENSIKNTENLLTCLHCSTEIGLFEGENMLYRHKVFIGQREELEELLEEALTERINENNREVHIGKLQIKLLKWGNFVYSKGKFRPCMNVLYKITESEGMHLPEEDLDKVFKALEKFNLKVPQSSKTFKEWKISLIVNN